MARERAAGLPERQQTLRQAMIAELRLAPATARDLSTRLGLREKDVIPHLEHLARSLRRGPERLVVEPAECLACGYRFEDRKKLSRPSACPDCRQQRIEPPIFRIFTPPAHHQR